MLQAILEQIEGDIEQVSTDGAYDHRHCYDEIENKGANAVIPPRKGAKIWQHGKAKERRTREMRICATFASMDANDGSATLATIVARLPKPPCFA